MLRSNTVFLMYHELKLEGRPTCRSDPGYLHYVLEEGEFRAHLNRMRFLNLRGMSVGEALGAGDAEDGAVITFDDGCETDLTAAAPLLADAGFTATFYVITGHIGRKGYLSAEQVRELHRGGFEIGCHTMNHPYLTELGRESLRVEIAEAKGQLEQIIGRRVDHFSCPGGRWNWRVERAVREAGYRSMGTSRAGANSPSVNPFRLARVPLHPGMPLAAFDNLVRGHGMLRRKARDLALTAAKSILGNGTYDRLRAALLPQN